MKIQKIFVQIVKYPLIIFLAIILGGSFHFFTSSVLGWTNPGSSPPGGNINKPINIGSVSQTKTGNLTIDSASYLIVGTTSGARFRASGNYIDFGETAQTIRQPGDYITFGPSATNMFNFFTTGSMAGRMGINTTSPAANLHVSGTTAITGNTTVEGKFWAGGPANFCRKESCSGSACTSSCSAANHYVVAIGGSDNRLLNPSSPAAATYRICCKNAD